MQRKLTVRYKWQRADGSKIILEPHEDELDDAALNEIPHKILERVKAGKLRATLSHEGHPVEYEGWWECSFVEPVKDLLGDIPAWRCTWCCKDTSTRPCEHCDNMYTIVDRSKPHRPEWSRATRDEVECKVCDRRGPYSIQDDPAWCDARNNPGITGCRESR